MTLRIPFALASSEPYPEEVALTDTVQLRTGADVFGNIAAQKLIQLASGTQAGDSLAYGQSGAQLDGLDLHSKKLTEVGSPELSSEAANKQYVDNLSYGLSLKPPVRLLMATSVETLAGEQTLDGILTQGSRVLLTAQSSAVQNGIWVTGSGSWTRPNDFTAGLHAANYFCFVEKGSYADQGWLCTSDSPTDVIGTHSLTWVQFSSAGAITASHGLKKVGNDIQINPGEGIDASGTLLNVALDQGVEFASGLLRVKPYLGLEVVSDGLQIKLDGSTIQTSSSGVSVKGLPTDFEIGGVATSGVTAAKLGTLTAGDTSNADSLHTHTALWVAGAQNLERPLTADESITAGDPVYISSANRVSRGMANTNTKSRLIGVAKTSASSGNAVTCTLSGVVPGVLSNAIAGAPVFLGTTGGLTYTAPMPGIVVLVGYALNATDLFVQARVGGIDHVNPDGSNPVLVEGSYAGQAAMTSAAALFLGSSPVQLNAFAWWSAHRNVTTSGSNVTRWRDVVRNDPFIQATGNFFAPSAYAQVNGNAIQIFNQDVDGKNSILALDLNEISFAPYASLYNEDSTFVLRFKSTFPQTTYQFTYLWTICNFAEQYPIDWGMAIRPLNGDYGRLVYYTTGFGGQYCASLTANQYITVVMRHVNQGAHSVKAGATTATPTDTNNYNTTHNGANSAGMPNPNIFLGGYIDGVYMTHPMLLTDFVLFDRVLTDNEVSSLETYLNAGPNGSY